MNAVLRQSTPNFVPPGRVRRKRSNYQDQTPLPHRGCSVSSDTQPRSASSCTKAPCRLVLLRFLAYDSSDDVVPFDNHISYNQTRVFGKPLRIAVVSARTSKQCHNLTPE